MSYCRFGKTSDVYVIATTLKHRPVWECFCARPPGTFLAKTRAEMVEHLREHRKRGDRVPESALQRLWREIQADR